MKKFIFALFCMSTFSLLAQTKLPEKCSFFTYQANETDTVLSSVEQYTYSNGNLVLTEEYNQNNLLISSTQQVFDTANNIIARIYLSGTDTIMHETWNYDYAGNNLTYKSRVDTTGNGVLSDLMTVNNYGISDFENAFDMSAFLGSGSFFPCDSFVVTMQYEVSGVTIEKFVGHPVITNNKMDSVEIYANIKLSAYLPAMNAKVVTILNTYGTNNKITNSEFYMILPSRSLAGSVAKQYNSDGLLTEELIIESFESSTDAYKNNFFYDADNQIISELQSLSTDGGINFTKNIVGWYTYDDLAVKENQIESLSYYPNPVNAIINVEVEQATWLTIFDVNGKFVEKIQLSEGINNIDVNGLAAGVYILKTEGKTQTTKFVKL